MLSFVYSKKIAICKGALIKISFTTFFKCFCLF